MSTCSSSPVQGRPIPQEAGGNKNKAQKEWKNQSILLAAAGGKILLMFAEPATASTMRTPSITHPIEVSAEAPRAVAVQFGCPAGEMVETFRNEQAILRESDCGMELTYLLPDGITKPIIFNTVPRAERGQTRGVRVGSEFSVVFTDNYAIAVDGTSTEWEVVMPTQIEWPGELKGENRLSDAFDPASGLLYALSKEKRIYVIDVEETEGDWRRNAPVERIGNDAKLVPFGGLLLVLQGGTIPIIAFQNVCPEISEWPETDYPLSVALTGPIRVEEGQGKIRLIGGNATLAIRVGTEGEASTLSISVE